MIRVLMAVVVFSALGACLQPDGALQVVWSDGTGQVSSVDQALDFGPVAAATTAARTLTLRNAGKGPVTVSAVAPLGPDDAAFSLQLAPFTLQAGASRQVEARFTPSTTGDFSTSVRFDVDTGLAPVLKLKGHGQKSNCVATAALPFGAVTAGGISTATLTFTNSSDSAGNLDVAAPDDSQFTTTAGTWRLAPGETRVHTFTFSPTAMTGPRHTISSVTAPGCPVTRVLLTGDVVDAVLTWTPTSLDFDSVTTPSSRTVTFSNTSLNPVQLSQLNLAPVSNDWSYTPFGHALLVPGASPGPSGQLVPGTVSLVVSYSGLVSLMAEAKLLGRTDLAAQPQFELPMVAGAAGFLGAVPTVDFGEVPYFPPSTSATRRMTLRNAGARPLTLGAGPWTVTPANGNTNATDLCAGQLDATTGTCTQPELTLAPNESRVFELHATVTSLGDKAWQLAIPSSDPRGLLLVPVTAHASSFPPCNYRLSTHSLDVGMLMANAPREVSVTITNLASLASSECLFSNVHLGPQATPVFTLVGGEVQQRRLRGGESMTLTVRAETATPPPMVPTTVHATLSFEVSAPSNVVSLPVSATLWTSCLVFTPDAVDFGAVVLGRASLEREVRAYNRCTDVSLLTATTTGPEFVATATSQLLPTDGTPALARVSYRPASAGLDDASLAFNLTAAGQSWSERVQLRGTGSTSSLNTQTWTAGGPADVLFVLDNSCSMGVRQVDIVSNLEGFLQQAQGTGADFHLGATNTELFDNHLLYRSPGGTSVLTRSTPNSLNEWHGLLGGVCPNGLCPGGWESCIAGAIGALLPSPYGPGNPGFLRRDASLSVVCVTDEIDQSGGPVSRLVAQLRSLKNSPGRVRYSVIGPVSSACGSGGGLGDVADQLVNATGGLAGDLCSPTWGTTLTSIGERAFAATDGLFYLSGVPDLTAPIEVSVDGAACGSTAPCGAGSQCSVRTATCVLDQVGPQGEPVWSFDAPLNAVRFSSLRLPTRGQQVRVSWVEATVP